MLRACSRVHASIFASLRSRPSASYGGKPRERRSLWTGNLLQPVQAYESTSTDPHVNLSIEHHLLQSSPPDSTVLFFFTNSPSLVIGRNQNPWYETNLHLVRDGALHLVRRRSGGGTVFHDLGNINWTVISPSRSFARDTHASMVVRALRSPECGIANARVNDRHDIVLDQGEEQRNGVHVYDEHSTPWRSLGPDPVPSLKCSGSAFKITRYRALHHGTCLLRSDNLGSMGRLLKSPGKAYIQAKGVESVSSPVGNVGVSHEAFMRAVRQQFENMYNDGKELVHIKIRKEDALEVRELRHGYEELKTAKWTFGQTPRFSFTAKASEVGELAGEETWTIHAEMEKGHLKKLAVSQADAMHTSDLGKGVSLYDGSWSWTERIAQTHKSSTSGEMGKWMQYVFPLIGTDAYAAVK